MEPAKAPASAPPRSSGGGGVAGVQYAGLLKAYLQQKGPTKLAVLGSAVKRPATVPKLKGFLSSQSRFKYDATTDVVSLA